MFKFNRAMLTAAAALTVSAAAFAQSEAQTFGFGEMANELRPAAAAKAPSTQFRAAQPSLSEPLISSDGMARYVGGEVGWESVRHSYELRNGAWVHTDSLAHDTPKPRAVMTEAERRAFQELYTGG